MEISLLKYTNILTKLKDRTFLIQHDELIYKQTTTTEECDHVFHNEFLNFLEITGGKDDPSLSISTEDKNYFLKGTTPSDLILFKTFFNFLKFSYLINLLHYKFYKEEKYKFNTKEYVINLRQYAQSEIFVEVENNLEKNQEEFWFLIELLQCKLITFVNDLKNHVGNKEKVAETILESISKIEEHFNKNCVSIYNEKIKNSKNNSISLTKDVEKSHLVEKFIINLEKVQEVYLNLSRLFVELQKSILELRLKDSANNNSNNSTPSHVKVFLNTDIIHKHIFKYVRTEENNNQLNNRLQKESEFFLELKDKENSLLEKNRKQKEIFKFFLSNRSLQIFYCYKCGNLLKRTSRNKANCMVDTDCSQKSYFQCLKCNINHCLTCIVEVKNGKCAKGHLVFKYEGQFNRNCLLCDGQILLEGYGCNLCDISVCCNCYDTYGVFCPPKCGWCKYELLWRKTIHAECRRCEIYSDCNWKCFFCDFYFCNKCVQFPSNEYCGQLHRLQEYDITNIHDKERIINSFNTHNSPDISKINQLIYNPLNKFVFNCSVCDSNLSSKFKCCMRCNYSICNSCSFLN
jgi:hypothetical protein